jgi:hypothetical protein
VNNKITPEMAAEIRRLALDGLSHREIGERMGLSKSGVGKYANGSIPAPIEPKVTPSYYKPASQQEDNGWTGKTEKWWQVFGDTRFDDDGILYLDRLPDNILSFACLQVPFHHSDFIPFLAMIKARRAPEFVVIGGDLLDLLFGKFAGPDDMSATEEVRRGQEVVAELARLFPKAIVLTSNHVEDRIQYMKKQGRVPDLFMRQWRDVYGIPHSWKIVNYLLAGRWLFEHGHLIGKGSKPAIRQETVRRFKRFDVGGLTVVRAHRHTESGQVTPTEWESQRFARAIHYMGCGMDDAEVSYSRAGLWNTALHIDEGRAMPLPMEVNIQNKWTGRLINPFTGEPF